MLLQDDQERWAADFRKLKKEITKALFNPEVSIFHVGSTSVPGLMAKPIIDIDVVYGPGIHFDEVKVRLERMGYYHNGNQGIKEREVFKRCKRPIKHEVLDAVHHHLYVCPMHSEEFHRHLLFRNFLMENERERQQYQEIKKRLAEEAKQDGKKYAQLKELKASDFIHSVIERAKKQK